MAGMIGTMGGTLSGGPSKPMTGGLSGGKTVPMTGGLSGGQGQAMTEELSGGFAPQHDSWVGSVWGATEEAGQDMWRAARAMVSGEGQVAGLGGKTHASRAEVLAALPNQLSQAFQRHTMSQRHQGPGSH